MTCIIGMTDREEKKVYIGGDSAGTAGWSISTRADQKVFRSGPFIMGFSSSYRMGQLLRYCLPAIEHPEGLDSMPFMVTKFIPAVRETFRAGGYMTIKDGQETGGYFLVGYRGELFEVDEDYQVGQTQNDILSVGVGREYALGAMIAMAEYSPATRINRSLEIAAQLSAGVRGPFVIEVLE